MKIGEVAKATGLTTKTIRFYEAEGLLPDSARRPSGYREFGVDAIDRLEFIRKAKRLGLSLDEIKGILQVHDLDEPTCIHVRSLLDEKVAQVEKALRDLQEFRAELTQLRDEAGTLEDCRTEGGRICGIIESTGLRLSDDALAWIAGKPAR